MEWVGTKLRGLSFYRRIPKDLTEATLSGGTLSLVASLFMFMLFGMELRAFLAVGTATEIVIDQSTDGRFRINFNITLPKLQCEWASVDVRDVIGNKRYNISKHIGKQKLDHKGGFVGKAEAVVSLSTGPPVEWDNAEREKLEAEGEHPEQWTGEEHSVQLDDSNMDTTAQQFNVLLVNYYAPWCPWSRRLQPVWEHVAGMLKRKYPLETGRVGMARLDCTQPASRPVCMKHHIQAFPSIRVFRKGANVHEGARHGDHVHHEHESFRGDRTAAALFDFAEKVLGEVEDRRPAPAEQLALPSGGHGPKVEEVQGTGCQISGFVMANRVPGALVISAHSPTGQHSVAASMLNISHAVHSLAFGNLKKREGRRTHKSQVEEMVSGSQRLDGASFSSEENGVTHEHYLKVVSTSFVTLGGESVETYQFTVSSNVYKETYDEGLNIVPSVKFTYDLSPMQVVVKETSRTFFEFLTSVCAIIGGVYTVTGLVEGTVQASLRLIKKERQGKLS